MKDKRVDKQQLQELLDRYMTGELTKAELRLMEDFFDSYKSETGIDQEELLRDDKQVGKEILQRILTSSRPGQVIEKTRSWMNGRLRIAACLLFLVALAYAIVLQSDEPEKTEKSVNEWIVKKNPSGQKMVMHLNDGSEVILNSGSEISYKVNFDKRERKLQLKGEAYFKVAKDTLKPFKIVTDDLTTIALGTEFNIKAYKEEAITVALVKGKVSVNNHQENMHNKIILEPGEAASLDMAGKNLIKFNFDENEHIAWKNGILYFKDADEQQVFEKLQRWYGIIILGRNHSPHKWEFSGEFRRKSLKNVLQSMSFAKKFMFEIQNDTVFIKYKYGTPI